MSLKYVDYLFCTECGGLRDHTNIVDKKMICPFCKSETDLKVFEKNPFKTEVVYAEKKHDEKTHHDKDSEYAIVDEICPKCNNAEMKFFTLQMRSADEGQTVFLECLNCSYKYSTKT